MQYVRAAALAGILVVSVQSGARSASETEVRAVVDAAGRALGVVHLRNVHGWQYHAAVSAAGLHGTADAWVARARGAEATYAQLPPVSQDTGFDGTNAWTRDDKGVVVVDGSAAGRTSAVNALYRSTYALWTANHGGARIAYGGRRSEAGKAYDVVRVAPAGSVAPFDYWFDARTHLPSRVVETIAPTTTTTTFANYRLTPAGFRIPYAQTSVDSQGNTTVIALDRVTLDPGAISARVRKPVSNVNDFSIAGGVETSVPFQLIDNHVYLDIRLDGKGPYRFIFDTGGQNIIDPAVAQELGRTSVGGVQGGGVGAATEQLRFTRIGSVRVGNAELRD